MRAQRDAKAARDTLLLGSGTLLTLVLAALIALRRTWADLTKGTLSVLDALDAGTDLNLDSAGNADEFEMLRLAIDRKIEAQWHALEAQRQARQASERRFRSIFEHSDQFIVLLDQDGLVVDLNPDALRFLDLEREQVALVPPFEAGGVTNVEACDTADAFTLVVAAELGAGEAPLATPTRCGHRSEHRFRRVL